MIVSVPRERGGSHATPPRCAWRQRPASSAAARCRRCRISPRLPELPALPDLPEIPGVYRIDVQQGNVVEQQMLDRLEIGMERSKVRFIMGTPTLVDPFNQDRWDYVYSLRRGSGEEIAQRVSLYFVDGRLARVDGDLASEAIPEAAAQRIQTRVKVPKRPPPEGFLDRLTPDFLSGDDEPAGSGAEGAAQPASE